MKKKVYINPVGVLETGAVRFGLVRLSATTDNLLRNVVFRDACVCTSFGRRDAEKREQIVILVKVRLIVHGEVWEHLFVADRAVSTGNGAGVTVGLVAREVGTVGRDVGNALGTKTPEIARSFRIAVV